MGEIKDFINLYIEDSGMIDEMLDDITLNLTANIQDELYPGHGWITGNLHDNIQSNITSKNKLSAVIEAYTMVEYAPYVNDGHHSFGGYHFMEAGLEKTVAMYR
jgi:hypothetical protein